MNVFDRELVRVFLVFLVVLALLLREAGTTLGAFGDRSFDALLTVARRTFGAFVRTFASPLAKAISTGEACETKATI